MQRANLADSRASVVKEVLVEGTALTVVG